MGLLMESVKKMKQMSRCQPTEVTRQIFIEQLQALNVSTSRSGKPIEDLSYAELKQELAIVSILNIDIEAPANKFF